MNEFLKRSITGILYVFILLSAVFLSHDAFNFLFLVFGLVCLYEFKKLIKLRGYYIFIAFLGLWWFFTYLLNETHERQVVHYALLAGCLTINLFLIRYLLSAKKRNYSSFAKFTISLLYIGGGCIFLTLIPYHEGHFTKSLIIGVFILIWTNDTFAYFIGKTMGRRPLYSSISPRKTLEGSIAGVLGAGIAGYLFSQYQREFTPVQWVALALLISIAGICGDLIESKFKRAAAVKDSGAILPGHGGLLDRLDSLIFAAPFVYLFIQLIAYVSQRGA